MSQGSATEALGTSFLMWLCPQTYPQSASPGILKPAAKFATQFLCCVSCDFLLILALLPVLLHSTDYLGTPPPTSPIIWFPSSHLEPLYWNKTLIWHDPELGHWFPPREKDHFPGRSSQNLNPANSSLLDNINCWRLTLLSLFLCLSLLPSLPLFRSFSLTLPSLISLHISPLKSINLVQSLQFDLLLFS